MRTRIALVAIIPIALITVSLLALAATAPPARAAVRPPHAKSTHRSHQLTVYVRPKPLPATTLPDLDVTTALLTGRAAGSRVAIPVVLLPEPVLVDTVTPAQRAAWSRVASCEEGGNWEADGPRFSGGLGITRINWANYGGLQYAPSAARATPDQQIMVAERIQYSPPDQYRCSSW